MMKRAFDIGLSLISLILFAPLLIALSLLIMITDGRPVFYISERMRRPGRPFQLFKFRTMTVAFLDAGVTGGDKSSRITRLGRILRRTRLDEVPQLINILKGDMSFVGPRPPLRQYTDAYPDVYAQVLQNKPGITGLATLHFHGHEEQLIARAKTPEETELIYRTRCIPRKATLDLIYQRHASICFDAVILWQTLARVVRRR